MPFTSEDTELYRRDVAAQGAALSPTEREALLKKYLPSPPQQQRRASKTTKTDRPTGHKRRVRPYIKSKIYLIFHILIQFVFGIYMRFRQITNAIIHKFLTVRHYHHRTPAYIQKDTQSLSRLPDHLSIILRYNPADDDGSALETLIDEVAELSAWSAAAGIPLLSVYEKSGILKSYMSAVQELVHQKLVQYFGPAPLTPKLRVYAPNLPVLSPAQSPSLEVSPEDLARVNANGFFSVPHLNLLLLSASDGRDTLVDLTRTLAEMSQSSKLQPSDINSSLINTEINATTAVTPREDSPFGSEYKSSNGYSNTTKKSNKKETAPSEPDLLIIFGPYVKLDGYPPWQVRLTEIFCVGDSGGDVSRGISGRTRVEYQAFLRALWKYSGAQMRFGR